MSKYYIGVDLGGTNIAIGITDENFKIIKKDSVPTERDLGEEHIVSNMAKLSKDLCSRIGISINDVTAAGIAAPGTINPQTGIIEYSNNIKFANFPMVKRFSELTGIPESKIAIGNDANLAALGEFVAGAAKEANSSVMITLGTGVGGGVVMDGKMLLGCKFGGAELGHTVIVENGRQCTCGRKGCMEAYCSATALITLTKEKFAATKGTLMHEMCNNDINKVGGRTAFAAMKKGDKAGAEVVEEYITHLACGITNLLNIFQPDVLLIGGGVCNEGDNLLIPLREKCAKEVYSLDHVLKSQILVATLGNDAGIIGAAAAGADK
ncbi:MAG: ROK family protein [Clostridia bacterium]|nr:ROK family protein [Clostridia bacterium]